MMSSDNKRLLAALEANWQAEMKGHYTYAALRKAKSIRNAETLSGVWLPRRNIMLSCGLDVSSS